MVIEELLKVQKERAFTIMESYKDFLIKSSKDLLIKKSFTKEEFKNYASDIFDFSNDSRDSSKIDTNTNYYELLMKQ